MPWKASSAMDERLRFVARLLEGEAMTDLGREFGIFRKTGYKVFNRYKDEGGAALSDRSRRPVRYANQLPPQVESLIVGLKRDKPHWGARKLREPLVRRLPGDARVPAKSTIHTVLDRHGLGQPPRSAPHPRPGHPARRGRPAQRPPVRRLQRRAQARQRSLPATRSPSPTTPPASCCSVRRSTPSARIPPSPPSSASFMGAGCPSPSGPTTASPPPAPTPSSTSPSCPSGGSASASPSRASSPATRGRTADMSACI